MSDVDISILPRVLPWQWRAVEERLDGFKYLRDDGFSVIASIARQQDGRSWLHVSCARPNRLPSWEDLRLVKDMFIGPERTAIQVLPTKAKHVNIHPYCLHLWCCLDGDVLPDFTKGSGSL